MMAVYVLVQSHISTSGIQTDIEPLQKVTITTCHAAKGLEWPVVIIPAGMCAIESQLFLVVMLVASVVEMGTFPSNRAEDIEEER